MVVCDLNCTMLEEMVPERWAFGVQIETAVASQLGLRPEIPDEVEKLFTGSPERQAGQEAVDVGAENVVHRL